ncbi:hypothetical protein Ancab_002233, partial [Ancistrocladus abbreviatus]
VISESISVSVGDDTFLLTIFEESVGDTIFSKGFDRLQEVEKCLPVSAYGPPLYTMGIGFFRDLSPQASMANRGSLNSSEIEEQQQPISSFKSAGV